jgi:hypothetical protein
MFGGLSLVLSLALPLASSCDFDKYIMANYFHSLAAFAFRRFDNIETMEVLVQQDMACSWPDQPGELLLLAAFLASSSINEDEELITNLLATGVCWTE